MDNQNKRWNNVDIKNILIDLKNDVQFSSLESKYLRTTSAIKSKLLDLSYLLVDIYDFDIELVSDKFKLDKSEILNYIEFKIGKTKFLYDLENKLMNVEVEIDENSTKTLFNGIIKNISELVKLIKQIKKL